MKNLRLPATVAASALALGLSAASCFASEGAVTIISPKNGDTLDIMAQSRLHYNVNPGPRGDHVHVYVDDKEVGILRQLNGSYTFETLAEGKRRLCIKVVNKAHVPVGVEQCVTVTVG